ncbi:hypothetical protein AciPR4_2867 [Terriglobus saanensis SP1PR4]|uniref:Uncharacterized protein n=1 Tax=Terriglobus saanensis (strain ATCC BAA-1853 / DSM 23119 / SP1PR4) TaxID=401053 RepID=E8V485_TERSS|nr:hypothetical protein AciPR4_2867 [Terriglobus saanensis SP1PR4]
MTACGQGLGKRPLIGWTRHVEGPKIPVFMASQHRIFQMRPILNLDVRNAFLIRNIIAANRVGVECLRVLDDPLL